MDYEWDPAKAKVNILKHGVAFEILESFEWNPATIMEDRRQDYGEPRFIAVGMIEQRLHVLVFTPRGAKIRVISLRKANEREKLRHGRP